MKNNIVEISKRFLNVVSMYGAGGTLYAAYESVANHRFDDGIAFGLGLLLVVLILNYVFFGVITIWNGSKPKIESKKKTETDE